jgi:hypothetical protein
MRALSAVLAASLVPFSLPASAQSIRDHVRIERDRSTVVTESQANELRLTVAQTAVRSIQVWIRAAGVIDESGKVLTAVLPQAEAALVKPGQRVRAFPPESRSSMYQARVIDVRRSGDGIAVKSALSGPAREGVSRYVIEIVTEVGDYLSVPNEAIIESEGKRIVYVQQQGRYVPKEIEPGLQGELYTEIVKGLNAGEQVVTFGSFFIDADYKLKGS